MKRLKFDKIVPHGGTAHWDDFVATCLILANNPEAVVERRVCTDSDLLDPRICVLDQGSVHNLVYGNFDHHQMSMNRQAERDLGNRANTPAICSIHLVLDAMGLLDEASESMPWLRVTGMMDNWGPEKTANFIGITPKILFAITGDLNKFILKQFETNMESIRFLMVMFGQNVIDNVTFKSWRMKMLSIKHLHGAGQYWYMDLRGIDNPFIFVKEAHPKVDFMIGDNTREGEGVVLRSYVDTTGPDFRVWKDNEHVKFVHQNGFLCVLNVGIDPIQWIKDYMV